MKQKPAKNIYLFNQGIPGLFIKLLFGVDVRKSETSTAEDKILG